MASRNERLKQDLAAAGVDPDAVEYAFRVDAVLQRWRRRFQKRELGQRAIAEMRLPIDLSQLDALTVIWSPANEYAEADEAEVMVGTVAQRLAIDPSRASRIVSELIRRGLVTRGVSQSDARRAILALTPLGDTLVETVREYKFLHMGAYLASWTPEERADFLPLLDRFSRWSTDPEDPDGVIAADIEKLRRSVSDLTVPD